MRMARNLKRNTRPVEKIRMTKILGKNMGRIVKGSKEAEGEIEKNDNKDDRKVDAVRMITCLMKSMNIEKHRVSAKRVCAGWYRSLQQGIETVTSPFIKGL